MSNATQYREVPRKANAGERIKIVDACYAGVPPVYANGDELTVVRDFGSMGVRVDRKWDVKSGIDAWVAHREYVVLEPIVAPAPLAETAALNLPDLFAQFIRDNAPAVRSYLAEIDPVESAEPLADVFEIKTPLTRAKVIEMARERVAYLTARLPFNGEIKFRVNRERRTVVAEGYRNGVRTGKFYAKCAPDDVFNADIGKAIAAERALGLAVTDAFVNAPKPDKAVPGVVIRKVSGAHIGTTRVVERTMMDGKAYVFTNGYNSEVKNCAIIDDTGAAYTESDAKDGEAA